MTEPAPTPHPDEQNAELTPAQLRGARLTAWMKDRGLTAAELARMTGLTIVSISKYMRGVQDIAMMQPKSITKLLTGMYVSDAWAREYFLIPAELESSWYSSRSGDMGSAGSEDGTVTHYLATPLKGEWIIPGPSLVTVDPASQEGLLLAQVGQHYWLAAGSDLPQTANILGEFKHAAPAKGEPVAPIKKPSPRERRASAPAGA